MAVVADTVIVEFQARLDRYEANVARAEQKFDKAMSGIQKSASGTERLVSRAAGAMTAALAGVSAIALARQFLEIADEAKNLNAQLKLATDGFGAIGQAQEDVKRIADETRSGLSETADLYAKFVRGAKELGATQADASRATETFSKTLRISGASAAESASATLQFGQALASGALRGDELNSILEAAPRLAKLLAQSMDQPIGAIRQLGAEGKLTSDILLKALTDQKFTDGIDREFSQLPVTFDQAMTRVKNSAITVFGAFDRGGEFSTALANFVSDGASGFGDMEKAAEDFGITFRSNFDGAIATGQQLISVIDGIGSAIDYVADSAVGRFIGRINELTKRINPLTASINAIAGDGSTFDQARQASLNNLQNKQTDRRLQDFLTRGGALDVQGNPVAGTPGAAPGTASAVSSSSSGKAKKSKLNADAFAREEASINDRILSLKSEEATTIEERAQIELDRIEAARKANVADIAHDQRYTAVQREQIIALTNTVSSLEAAQVVRKRQKDLLEQQFDLETAANRGAQDLAKSSLEIAGTRAQQYEVEKRILKLRQSQERAEYENLLQSRNPQDQVVGRAGLARLDTIQANERTALDRRFESPLEQYARSLRETDTADRVQSYVVDELQSVQDGIAGALQKAIGTKDPLIAGLINLFIEQVIMKPIAEALARQSGGGNGFLGSVIGIAGGALLGFAGGGSFQIGGRGGTDRNVLSLNGKPVANVSRGETINVSNSPLSRGGGQAAVYQTFVLDARGGITTPELLQYVNQTASQEGQRAYSSAVRDTPLIMGRRQRFGS